MKRLEGLCFHPGKRSNGGSQWKLEEARSLPQQASEGVQPPDWFCTSALRIMRGKISVILSHSVYGDWGNEHTSNLSVDSIPTFLLEPCFILSPWFSTVAAHQHGLENLQQILAWPHPQRFCLCGLGSWLAGAQRWELPFNESQQLNIMGMTQMCMGEEHLYKHFFNLRNILCNILSLCPNIFLERSEAVARRLSTQTLMALSQSCFHHEGVNGCSNSSRRYWSGHSPRCPQKHWGGALCSRLKPDSA